MTEDAGALYDAIIIGTGFAGVYGLHRMREAGFRVIAVEAGDAPRLGRSLDQRRQAVEGMQLADDAGVAIREPVERRVVLRPRRIVRFLFHIDLQGSGAQPRVRPGSQVERAGTAAIRTMHSSTATRNGTVARNSGPIRMSAATIAM